VNCCFGKFRWNNFANSLPQTRHAHIVYGHDVLKFYLTRALELLFIDLAAAVNTCNLEGMPTFDVQAMVLDIMSTNTFGMHRYGTRGYFLSERSLRIRQLRPWILSIHSFEVLKHSHLAVHDRKSLKTIMHVSKILFK